jgi:hypothetical protein
MVTPAELRRADGVAMRLVMLHSVTGASLPVEKVCFLFVVLPFSCSGRPTLRSPAGEQQHHINLNETTWPKEQTQHGPCLSQSGAAGCWPACPCLCSHLHKQCRPCHLLNMTRFQQLFTDSPDWRLPYRNTGHQQIEAAIYNRWHATPLITSSRTSRLPPKNTSCSN